MKRDDFKRKLDQLQEVVLRALSYYTVWKALKFHDKQTAEWSLEDQNHVLGRFRGFFTPVGAALQDMALLEFAKMFDGKRKTASLRTLVQEAVNDPSLVPFTTPDELQKAYSELDPRLVNSLKLTRHQRLAHVQEAPQVVDPIMTKDVDKLADCVMSAFNTLSIGYDQKFVSLDFSLSTSGRDTAEVFRILLDHQERAHEEHDKTMVGIGLDQLRRAEDTLGGRVAMGEQRAVIETLGLTPDQMQRVEQRYNAHDAEGVQDE